MDNTSLHITTFVSDNFHSFIHAHHERLVRSDGTNEICIDVCDLICTLEFLKCV